MLGYRTLPKESTGTEALDALIGGSVSIANALILLDEKGTNEYFCRPIQRCFIAEGLDMRQRLFLASPIPGKMQKILREMPAKNAEGAEPSDGAKEIGEIREERFKIAWRYRTKPEHESTIGSRNASERSEGIGSKAASKFDLSRVDDRFDVDQLLVQGHVTVFDWDQQQPSLTKLWAKIHREFVDINGPFLRLVIADLSSPLWADANLLQLFCAHLKAFCRRRNSSALLSMDSSSLSKAYPRQNILQFVDASFQMERMDEKEQKMLCLRRRIDGGRFYIVKMAAIRSAAPAVLPAASDLLFSLRRHSFELKLLHLPPALGEEKEAKQKTNCHKAIVDQF